MMSDVVSSNSKDANNFNDLKKDILKFKKKLVKLKKV